MATLGSEAKRGSSTGRSWLKRLVLATGLLGSLAVVGVAPTAAITATPFDTNLIKNGGFEAGVGGDGTQSTIIPNWLLLYPQVATVVAYGSPGGFPTRAESRRIGGGDNFLSCGPNTSTTGVRQARTIIGRDSLIDQGRILLTVKARIATYDGQADYGYIQVGGKSTQDPGSHLWNWTSPSITATNGRFKQVLFATIVPAQTRYIDVWLIGVRPDGSGPYCDAYFDKVSMVIKKIT